MTTLLDFGMHLQDLVSNQMSNDVGDGGVGDGIYIVDMLMICFWSKDSLTLSSWTPRLFTCQVGNIDCDDDDCDDNFYMKYLTFSLLYRCIQLILKSAILVHDVF